MAGSPKRYDTGTRISELERRVRQLETRATTGTENLNPAGSMMMWAGPTAPNGYLLCNGAAVSRDEYPELFSAIGTRYGAGNGSTTFNLPDLTERFPLGPSAERGLGTAGGSKTIALSQMPSHAHNGSGLSTTAGGAPHQHDFTIKHLSTTTTGGSATRVTQVASRPSSADGQLVTTQTQVSGINHSHNVTGTTGTNGSGVDYLPPYLSINYIIRAA